MKNIIVVGYPKSGNTWVARLTAELVGCPVVGFWRRDDAEIAQEGENRVSDFRCFKSHHQLHELGIEDGSDEFFIIYVLRDPRDVVISGAHYFELKHCQAVSRYLEKMPLLRKLYYKLLYDVICPRSSRVSAMINAVLYGYAEVHHWCRIPWKAHFEPYLRSGHLFVRYEDMLAEPSKECNRILDYLGLSRQEAEINAAIRNQSFEKKKAGFLSKGDKRKAHFLRSGKSGQWKHILSQKQKDLFAQLLRDELLRFSYSVDDELPQGTAAIHGRSPLQ